MPNSEILKESKSLLNRSGMNSSFNKGRGTSSDK